MGTMYDSVSAVSIPPDAAIAAGYVNGRYKWSDADWRRFSGKTVRIQVFIPGLSELFPNADVLDVEASDAASPAAQATIDAFVKARRAQGKVPCIYTSQSTLHYVWRGPDVDYWVAALDGRERLLPGSCATQWVDSGKYDVSVTADWWPRDYSQSQKDVPPMPNGKPVGIWVTPAGDGYIVVGDDGGVYSYGDVTYVNSLPGQGVKPNAPIVDFDVVDGGRGIVMVGADWGVYCIGTVNYLGHP